MTMLLYCTSCACEQGHKHGAQRSVICGGDAGFALATALMTMLLLSAMGAALVLTTTVESVASARARDSVEALHAAEGGLDRALSEIRTLADWNALLASADGVRTWQPSAVAAGSPVYVTVGSRVDLARITQSLNCPQIVPPPALCPPAAIVASASGRPWGANNPVWHLFSWGALSEWTPPVAGSAFYAAVWVADDQEELDGNPLADSAPGRPGAGVIQVRADAFGPGGSRRAVVAVIARTAVPGGIRVLARHVVR